MLEVDDRFNDNGKGMNSYCAGEDNGKLLYFTQENHMDRKYKMIDEIGLDDGHLRSDGTQHTTEEELNIF